MTKTEKLKHIDSSIKKWQKFYKRFILQREPFTENNYWKYWNECGFCWIAKEKCRKLNAGSNSYCNYCPLFNSRKNLTLPICFWGGLTKESVTHRLLILTEKRKYDLARVYYGALWGAMQSERERVKRVED